jgi:hypothetical protein
MSKRLCSAKRLIHFAACIRMACQRPSRLSRYLLTGEQSRTRGIDMSGHGCNQKLAFFKVCDLQERILTRPRNLSLSFSVVERCNRDRRRQLLSRTPTAPNQHACLGSDFDCIIGAGEMGVRPIPDSKQRQARSGKIRSWTECFAHWPLSRTLKTARNLNDVSS